MMCYRDITFCSFNNCRKWGECRRALTEAQQKMAEAWWMRGGGDKRDTPIAKYINKPSCYEV